VVVIDVADWLVIVAAFLLKVTAETIFRLVPVMTTVLPTPPSEVSATPLVATWVIVAAPSTTSGVVDMPSPDVLETVMSPPVLSAGTVTVSEYGPVTEYAAFSEPILTAVTWLRPVTFEPLTVTDAPGHAGFGEKSLLTVGAAPYWAAAETGPEPLPVAWVPPELALWCVTLWVRLDMLEAAELNPPVAPTTATMVAVTAAATPKRVRVRTGLAGRGLARAASAFTNRAWGSGSTFSSPLFFQLLSQLLITLRGSADRSVTGSSARGGRTLTRNPLHRFTMQDTSSRPPKTRTPPSPLSGRAAFAGDRYRVAEKKPAVVAVPAAFRTVTCSDPLRTGTRASIRPSFTTVKRADVRPNRTEVVPVNPDPLMST